MSLETVIGLAVLELPVGDQTDTAKVAETRAIVIKEYAGADNLAIITQAGGQATATQVAAYIKAAQATIRKTVQGSSDAGKKEAIADVVKRLRTVLPGNLTPNADANEIEKVVKNLEQERFGVTKERDTARTELQTALSDVTRLNQQLQAAQKGGSSEEQLNNQIAALKKGIDVKDGQIKELQNQITTEAGKYSITLEACEQRATDAATQHNIETKKLQSDIAVLTIEVDSLKQSASTDTLKKATDAADATRRQNAVLRLAERAKNIRDSVNSAHQMAKDTRDNKSGDKATGDKIIADADAIIAGLDRLPDQLDITNTDGITLLEGRSKEVFDAAKDYDKQTSQAADAEFKANQNKAIANLTALKDKVDTESKKPGAGDAAQLLVDIKAEIDAVNAAKTLTDLLDVARRYGDLKTRTDAYKAPAAAGANTTPSNLIVKKFANDGKSVAVYPDEYGISWLDSTARAWLGEKNTVQNIGDIFKLHSDYIVSAKPTEKQKETARAERIRDAALVLSYGSLDAFNNAARSANAPAYMFASEADFLRAIEIMKGHVAVDATAHRKYLHSIIKHWAGKTQPKTWPPVEKVFTSFPQGWWVYIKSLPALDGLGSRYATGYAATKDNQDGSVVKYETVNKDVLTAWDTLLRSKIPADTEAFTLIAGGIGDSVSDDYEPDLMGTDDARLVDLAAASDATPGPQSTGPSWSLTGASRTAFDSFFGAQ